jgi:transcriptional regulator
LAVISLIAAVERIFRKARPTSEGLFPSISGLILPTHPLCFYKKYCSIPVEVKGERKMTAQHIDLPQGTLDLLILRTLALGPQHGWAISERVQQLSSDMLRIQQGSLYPALHRLERRGLIKARWGTSENNRRAKYYELSRNGRQQLEMETDAWEKLTAAVAQVLGTA